MSRIGQAPKRGKLEQIADALRTLAGSVGPGGRLPPLRRLVVDLDASQATVVRALEQLENENVIQRRHGSGIYVCDRLMANQYLMLIDPAFLIDVSPVFSIIITHLQDAFADRGLDVDVQVVPPEKRLRDMSPSQLLPSEEVVRKVNARGYRGAVLLGTAEPTSWLIDGQGIATAGFGSPARYIVHVHDSDTCQIGIQELVRLGCERIALLSPGSIETYEMANAMMASYNRVPFTSPVYQGERTRLKLSNRSTALILTGYEAALESFGNGRADGDRPDGVLLLNDMDAQGVLAGLHELGLQPGVDVKIATHANSGSTTLLGYHHQISRIEYSTTQLAAALVEAITCASEGRHPMQCGWDQAVVLRGSNGETENLAMRPTLYRLPGTE